MPKSSQDQQSWVVTLVVIACSAIFSGVSSGILGFFVDVVFFGWYEMALFGALVGTPVGFLLGGGIAWYLLRKGKSIWKVMATALVGALIISALVVALFSS